MTQRKIPHVFLDLPCYLYGILSDDEKLRIRATVLDVRFHVYKDNLKLELLMSEINNAICSIAD